jgi:squamous cell carcinoma antigen recognized by T-cells 3
LEQELWLEWLSDEKQLASTDADKLEIVDLYCTAVKDYNAIEIWVDFLEYLIQEYQDEDWISVESVNYLSLI